MATSSAAVAGRALRILLQAAAAVGLFASCTGASPPPATRPSIVLVVWDTCRGDRVGVNGYTRPTTPRLDELARTGVAFRQCFTPSPWTPPAHASIFTGLLPRAHGLREGMGDRVDPGIPLLARTLAAAGYETVCATANPQISTVTGLDAGFESCFPCYRSEDRTVNGEAVRDQVRRWLAARGAGGKDPRPVFLFLNLMETHLPYVFDPATVAAVHGDGAVEPARRAAGAVDEMEAKAHLTGVAPVEASAIRDLSLAYDGAVRRDDRLTGEILDALRDAGILGDALVAITSDHGENLGEHGELNHVLSVYDPVLRVPLVLHRPGHFEGGRVVDAQVRLQDLYPTILEAAGVPVPAPCGKDALSLSGAAVAPRTLVAEFGPMPRSVEEARAALPGAPASFFDRLGWMYRAVREPGGAKYVGVLRAGTVVREELYDVAADPGETRDLLGEGGPPGARATADRLRAVGEAGR